MAESYLQYVLQSEAILAANIQEIFAPLHPLLVGVSEFLSPASIIDCVIPILGSLSMGLMGEMTFVVGLLNLMSSVIKWIFPQHRVNWWISEHYNRTVIDQTNLTCDTTAGFPSAHSMAFTGLVYLCLLYAKLSPRTRYLAVTLLSIPMWIARMYFGSHFLHQCICGSFVAVVVVENMQRRRKSEKRAGVIFMESWPKALVIAAVTTVALFVIGTYFAMLYAGLDPHWSVRMAFKWCANIMFLRHETSPVFIMCRDLGFMMGFALSSPVSNRLEQRLDPKKSISVLVLILAINLWIRSKTPKNYGRAMFVGYEFVRNAMHSFALLTVLPKFCSVDEKKQVNKE